MDRRFSRNDGSLYPLLAESVAGAGSTRRMWVASYSGHHFALIRRGWNAVIGRKDSAVNTVTAPNKMQRLEKFFWSQMPYHPQYV